MRKMIKPFTAAVLSACLLACAVPVSAAGPRPLALTVAADTHYQCPEDLGEMSDVYTEYMLEPELYGYASTQGQMNYESGAILAAMLDSFAASSSPYLLIAGDLTCGKRASHLKFAEYLRDCEKRSGKSIFVINGNHDCDAESDDRYVGMEEFREIYAEFGYDEALDRHETSASYTADLSDDYRLIALDSCIYGEDDGEINASVFAWLGKSLSAAREDGRTPIVMMHHSILPHYELQPMLGSWRFFASYLADNGVQVVFTGHIHANDVSCAKSLRGNTIYDVQTGALITSPNTYRTAVFDGGKVDISCNYVTRIDVSLLPDAMSAAQKAALEADFPAYAYSYFENGVCKWLNRNVGSMNRLARWFRLEEGTAVYDSLERVMKKVGAAVGSDIYGGDGSLEAALSPFGKEVPPSAYVKPYQVAAKLMYGLFGGESGDSREDTQLLLVCLEGAVIKALSQEDEDVVRRFARAVVGSAASSEFGTLIVQAAEKTALALLETLAGGIVDDYSDPADLDVALPCEAEKILTLDPVLRLLQLFTELFERIFSAFGV
ncbi:MAG: metallophosphoesterase [Clostridia bacterium]|nr:metallophosphoesterase [Clostridia bacterium]